MGMHSGGLVLPSFTNELYGSTLFPSHSFQPRSLLLSKQELTIPHFLRLTVTQFYLLDRHSAFSFFIYSSREREGHRQQQQHQHL